MLVFFFQAEDGIRDLVRSRGLGDVYKRQVLGTCVGGDDEDGIVFETPLVAGLQACIRVTVMNLSLIHI